MVEKRSVVVIDSEKAVWAALQAVLRGEIGPENTDFHVQLKGWAAVNLKFEGEPYKATLPTSAMKGIVEFQAALHRSAALILKDKARSRNLTPEELIEYELVFKVTPGSSNLYADASAALKSLAERALDKMSNRETFICALVFMGLFFTSAGGYVYLNHALDMEKLHNESRRDDNQLKQSSQHDETIRHLSADGLKREKILADALKQSDKAQVIRDQSEIGYDAIVRNADRVDVLVLQGAEVTKENIDEITRRHRRASEKRVIKGVFRVEGVDTTDPRSFVVRLKSDGEELITAKLDDAVGMDRFKAAIQKAEWGRTTITATVSGRMIGDEFRDARILTAHTTRQARAKK